MMIRKLIMRGRFTQTLTAPFSQTLEQMKSQREGEIKQKLMDQLQALEVIVKDIGSGCGTMYDIKVESNLFEGQSRLKQHQMVQNVIKEELKSIHGLNLKTIIPQKIK